MKTNSLIESLEARIAPAAVTINPAAKFATWTDFDGDAVTLKWTTNAPTFTTTDQGMGLRVEALNLTLADNSNEAFTLTVKAGALGDGRIDLGRISAVGVPLKSWSSPAASVLEIDCGDGTTGIGSLKIGTLAALPPADFAMSGANSVSNIKGAVSTVTVQGDIASGALILDQAGHVKSISVSGSLRGTDVTDSGLASGILAVFGTAIDSVTIGGSVLGGTIAGNGQLALPSPVGKLTIKGSIVGGSANSTGLVSAGAKVVVIGGNVQGGSGTLSGFLGLSNVKTLGIGGSILGGSEAGSGRVSVDSATAITIKGSIIGGFHTTASMTGITGTLSAAGNVGSIKIGGDLVSGTFGTGTKLEYNGAVTVNGKLGSLAIVGGVHGNRDTNALIIAKGVAPALPGNYNAIGKITIGGTLSYGYIASGHAADTSGDVADRIGAAENPDAGIGSISIGGDWFHSNITAGVNDASTTGFSSGDTHGAGDPARLAVLGPVTIKGFILDNPSVPNFSGFGADKIASIIAHGVKVFKTGDAARSLDAAGFVDVKEFA